MKRCYPGTLPLIIFDEARILYLGGDIYQVIYKQKEIRDRDYPECPHVFFLNGEKLSDFRYAWKSACKRAGLPGKLFHDLRRTGGPEISQGRVPEKIAIKISGHKTQSIFERYNIINEDDLKVASKKFVQYHNETEARLKNSDSYKTVTKTVTVDNSGDEVVQGKRAVSL